MRIAKNTLYPRWAWTSALAILAFILLTMLNMRLKALTGYEIADLWGLTAPQLHTVFQAWSAAPNAAIMGFSLGFDYLFMPLYAAAFFYSGIVAAEAFAPKPSLKRRLFTLAAMVPLAGALCEAVRNALEIWMFVSGVGDRFVHLAAMMSEASLIAFGIGLCLFVAALMGHFAKAKKQPDAANTTN